MAFRATSRSHGFGPRVRGPLALLAVSALSLALPLRARAYEALVQASVSSQSYQIRDAEGAKLGLQRLDTYLRLFITDLLPEREERSRAKPGAQMHIVMSMRMRADMGTFTRGWDPSSEAHGLDTWVSGAGRPTLELLNAHLAATDIAGFMDFKLGRLFQLDPLDFYGFDGLQARARLPFHLGLELVAGLRNSGHWAIDAPIFLADGTSLSDSRPGAFQPMVGAAVETHGLPWLRLRLAYRSTWHFLAPGDVGSIYPGTTAENVPRVTISEEKLTAYALGSFLGDRVTLYGGIRHNLLFGRLDEAQAGLALRLGRSSQLRAEYVRDQPDFDGDSLFNIFNAVAYQEVRLWYEHRFSARWQAYLRATVRLFGGGEEGLDGEEGEALEPDVGGGVGVHYLGSRLAGRLDLYWQEGYGGRTLG
ncbi:MAG: hypothetical protein RBU30_24360, partial [Polyangia bacterium]|nr:hypothetical protein [Polyangia bacterium]